MWPLLSGTCASTPGIGVQPAFLSSPIRSPQEFRFVSQPHTRLW